MECDILVVGAGASGSVAALALSQKNLDIVVIEKQSEIGRHTCNRIDITESVGLIKILNEFNLPIKGRTNKIKWFSPNYSVLLKSDIYDLYFKRGPSSDSFDVCTMSSALDNGVNLLLETEPVKFNFRDNIVESVVVKKNNKKQVIKPKIIVGADGFNSSVLGLLKIHEEKIMSMAGYGILGQDFDMPHSTTHVFFDKEMAPGGYFFIAKCEDGEGVACLVMDVSMTKKEIYEHYNNFVRQNKVVNRILRKSHSELIFKGTSGAGILEKIVSGNVLLIGDAARLIDPLFGYGMRSAIISGYLAADVSSRALEKQDIMELMEYEHKIMSNILNEKNIEMRKIFTNLDNNDFDNIIKTMHELSIGNMNLDAISTEDYYPLVRYLLG
ncbi:MAG: NAD(P)/FAD-dependent oxidoreductase [Candidatus Altiarchaeota archaeon]|nr:NAD(P)/FAD-dependent oxidoreductase [Candidatus Altiarchaeota archaeon]